MLLSYIPGYAYLSDVIMSGGYHVKDLSVHIC
jgi:hypothetical protein